MVFANKAETLLKLKKIFPDLIPKLLIFNSNKFRHNSEEVIKKIKKNFNNKIAVRSCDDSEDGINKSNAGKFYSAINVDVNSKNQLKEKINLVLNSYKKKNGKSLFFVQDMVENVKISGVLLTKSLNSNMPSFEVNYSRNKNTDIVTSGKSNSRNLIYFPNNKYFFKEKYFNNLINIAKKLFKIFKNDFLDIEFAIDKNNKIFILQVRPGISKKKYLDKTTASKILNNIEKKIKKLQLRSPTLNGETTFFGVMPDWNPAEIIGIKPKPLALSLYKELITDAVWAKNRSKWGFDEVDADYLLTTFYGTPYVDIRIDFNSWIPKNLKKNTKNKIINYYLNQFKKNRNLHDKIEFNILFTCYTDNNKKEIFKKLKNVLSNSELKNFIQELIKITNNLMNNFSAEIDLINILKKNQQKIKKSKYYKIQKIYYLIQDCKKFGTNPFASFARSAFVAMVFLESMVKDKIITKKDKFKFLSSINTITTEMINDHIKFSKKNFLKKYGHLRPNTYEITSLNYRENYNSYFKTKRKNLIKNQSSKFKFSKKQIIKIQHFLKRNKIGLTNQRFVKFLQNSIKLREYAKFIFSISIDEIFQNIKQFGDRIGIKRKDLSYLKIQDFMDLNSNLDNSDIKNNFRNIIKKNKLQYFFNKDIKLPDTIISTRDLYINHEINNKCNFITTKSVSGTILRLQNSSDKLDNKIILIENADPGYDFIFNRKIAGLITKYGGLNSHMAIRCAELSIPAAIGVGGLTFDKIKNKGFITLDCETKKID